MLRFEYKRDRDFEEVRPLMDDIMSGKRETYIFGLTSYAVTLHTFLNEKSLKVGAIH